VSGGQSYLSAPEKTLTFGLGDAKKIDLLEIRWPDSAREPRRDIPGGGRLLVEEGKPPAASGVPSGASAGGSAAQRNP